MNNGYLIVLPWGLEHIGGVNRAVLNLRRQLALNANVRPIVLISEYGYPRLKKVSDAEGFLVYRLTLRQPVFVPRSLRGLFAYLINLPGTVLQLRRLLKSERICAVDVHYPSLSALTFALAGKILSRKFSLILSFHGADVGNIANTSRLGKRLWRRLLLQASHVVACSNALCSRISKSASVPPGLVKTVHNGADQERLKTLAQQGAVPDALVGKQYVLNVATLEWKKGQDVLIRAFSRVASVYPEVILAIMGRSGDMVAELRSLIHDLALDDRVLIFENVAHDDVLATMKAAELFVLPSRAEPFGIVLLEAGVFAIPVIAADTGGIPEIVRNHECGVLVAPEDVNALSEAMLRLLGDAGEASRLAVRMHDRVTRKFTLASVAKMYEEIGGVDEMHASPECERR